MKKPLQNNKMNNFTYNILFGLFGIILIGTLFFLSSNQNVIGEAMSRSIISVQKRTPCSDECNPGQKRCSGINVEECIKIESSCAKWQNMPCPTGKICNNGICEAIPKCIDTDNPSNNINTKGIINTNAINVTTVYNVLNERAYGTNRFCGNLPANDLERTANYICNYHGMGNSIYYETINDPSDACAYINQNNQLVGNNQHNINNKKLVKVICTYTKDNIEETCYNQGIVTELVCNNNYLEIKREVACPSGTTCSDGKCFGTPCTPNCAGKVCGSDGCGGSCGTCPQGQICTNNGQCANNCTPFTCASLNKTCGTWSDGCGKNLTCGTCPQGQICNSSGQCINDCSSIKGFISETTSGFKKVSCPQGCYIKHIEAAGGEKDQCTGSSKRNILSEITLYTQSGIPISGSVFENIASDYYFKYFGRVYLNKTQDCRASKKCYSADSNNFEKVIYAKVYFDNNVKASDPECAKNEIYYECGFN